MQQDGGQGWMGMKRIGPMLLLAVALSGCGGPTSRQAGLLLSHTSIAVAVYAYALYVGFDLLLRRFRHVDPTARSWIVLLQLVVWMGISGLVSLYLFSHHSGDHFWVFSMRPMSEWLRIQLLSVLYLPVVVLYSVVFAWLAQRTRSSTLRELSLTGTMLAHCMLCAWLIVRSS